MKNSSMCLALAMVFASMAACHQVAEKPPRIITLKAEPEKVLPEKPLPNLTYRQWKAVCAASEECPYNAMRGMIAKAPNFKEAKEAFSYPSYKSPLKYRALVKMLNMAKGGEHYEVVAMYARPCLGPRYRRLQKVAELRARRARN